MRKVNKKQLVLTVLGSVIFILSVLALSTNHVLAVPPVFDGGGGTGNGNSGNGEPLPGCYIVQANSSTDTSTGSVFKPSSKCSGTDTNNQPINPSEYCYVSDDNGSTYAQEPCESLICQEGSAAIAGSTDPYIDCSPGATADCSTVTSTGAAIPQRDIDETCISTDCSGGVCNSIITKYVNPVIIFLGVGVGLVITIMIVIGGIQYTTSSGNPQAVEAAKKRIINALIALVTFGLMYALLNFIIPGGIF